MSVVGTPCYGRLVTDLYLSSLLKLQIACLQRNIDFKVKLIGGDALITRARQTIVAEFLSEGVGTHLLFIDTDIGFEPDQVFRLLDFGRDVTAAIYPLKRIDWGAAVADKKQVPLNSGALTYLVQFANGQKIKVQDGFAQVDYAGTGFFMIRKEALLGMINQYPELRYAHEHKPQTRR